MKWLAPSVYLPQFVFSCFLVKVEVKEGGGKHCEQEALLLLTRVFVNS